MEVIPAIDVLGGRVVRLLRGDLERVTDFGSDPAGIASRWLAEGAGRIHLVDLDGARTGRMDVGLVAAVAAAGGELQVGGGIRDLAAARAVIRAGAARVVVGTVVVHEAMRLADLTTRLGADRVVAAVDIRDDRARGSGWVDEGRDADEVLADLAASGVAWVLVTSIRMDGTLLGPDTDLLRRVREALPECRLIASGGIGALDHLRQVAGVGADAAVVGRALLEGRFTYPAAAAAAVA